MVKVSIKATLLYALSIFLDFIDIYTVATKNIRNMHAVSTNQIVDIFHFNDKYKH